MKKKVDLRIMAVVLSLVLAGIDQLTKFIVVMQLKPIGTYPLIAFGDTEVLNLTYCENTGMSFSMLEGQRVILILLPVLLIALVEWYIFSGRAKRTDMLIALSALAGGGLGNLIDRCYQGYVVDFIDFRIINFAIFNFADICAVCGGIYFGIALLIDDIREGKAKKDTAAEATVSEVNGSTENVQEAGQDEQN